MPVEADLNLQILCKIFEREQNTRNECEYENIFLKNKSDSVID